MGRGSASLNSSSTLETAIPMKTRDSGQTIGPKAELELVLMIVSDDPQSTLMKVANLTSIDGYQLVTHSPMNVHDIYLDTPDSLLSRKRLNLRIRGIGEDFFITLKVNPGLISWRRHERREFEVPWSQGSLQQIRDELERRGIKLAPLGPLTENMPRVETMKLLGLRVLQDRETHREARDIVEGNASREVLAELAIDSVLYHFEGRDVRLFELEVEAKSQRGRGVLGNIAKGLREKVGSQLRSWRFGKLVTGEKIDRLLKRGELQNFLDGSRLRPDAYLKIEQA